jgi:hypothetical protein
MNASSYRFFCPTDLAELRVSFLLRGRQPVVGPPLIPCVTGLIF